MIMDNGFTLRGELSLYTSLTFTRSAYDVGSFTLTLHPAAPCAGELEAGRYLFLSQATHKAMIIENLEQTEEKLTVTGSMIKGVVSRRVCVPTAGAGTDGYDSFGYDLFTGAAESAIKHYVGNNLTNPADEKRKMPGYVCAADQGRGTSLPWSARFDKLKDKLADISETCAMPWDVRPDFEGKRFVLDVYPPNDYTQGNRVIILSCQMGNASAVTYKRQESTLSTTVYVGGPGEDENRLILSVGNEAAGLARRELWAEAGSLSDIDLLRAFGQQKLEAAALTESLAVTVIDGGACRYERDWDLGDRVLVQSGGRMCAAPVISVQETYQAGERKLSVTLGAAGVSASTVLKRALRTEVR